MLSLHAVVGRAGAVGAVIRIADVVVDEGQQQQQGPRQKVAAIAATPHRIRITHGRTKIRRDRGTTIGNEGTTERWARQAVGPVAREIVMVDYYSYTTPYQTGQMNAGM